MLSVLGDLYEKIMLQQIREYYENYLPGEDPGDDLHRMPPLEAVPDPLQAFDLGFFQGLSFAWCLLQDFERALPRDAYVQIYDAFAELLSDHEDDRTDIKSLTAKR